MESLEGLGASGLMWRGKKVLVTGAAGFIGSHLSRRLLQCGAEVAVLLKGNSDLSLLRDILPRLRVHEGDLRDYAGLAACTQAFRPQVVFHLAALRVVERNVALSLPMIEVNVKGTMGLLQAVLEQGAPLERFVNTGTCEEYGDGPVPFSEEQRERPVSPYSASKVAATYFCESLARTKGLPILTVRPFLTYGPGQGIDMFVPSLISHCLEGKDFSMTAGDQTREFNYVDDIVEGFLAAASSTADGEVVNLGNGIEHRIIDVAEKIVEMMGNPIRLLPGTISKRPGESVRFFCNNQKAKMLLGWMPQTGLEEGLEKTIAWYRTHSHEFRSALK